MCLALLDIHMLERTHIVRFRTEEEIRPRSARDPEIDGAHPSAHRLRRAALGSLSWRTQREMSSANRAASFHVEATAAPGFKVIDPGLWVEDSRNIVRGGHWIHGNSGPTSSHLVYHPDPSIEDPEPVHLSLSLYAHRSGLLSESAAASLFVGIVLLVFTIRLEQLNFRTGEAALNSPFASALILFIPVFLSAVAVYKESVRIAPTAFAWLRLSLFFQFLAVVTAALPFAFELSPGPSEVIWYFAVSVGWLACIRVLAVAARHSWRVSDIAVQWRIWSVAI